MAEALEFDIRGQICPSTLLIALREMNVRQEQLRAGTLSLSFLTDNRDCLATIPDSARNMGFDVAVEKIGGDYRIEIHRGE